MLLINGGTAVFICLVKVAWNKKIYPGIIPHLSIHVLVFNMSWQNRSCDFIHWFMKGKAETVFLFYFRMEARVPSQGTRPRVHGLNACFYSFFISACKPGYQTQGTWCEMCQIGFYTVTGKEVTCTACTTGYTTSNPGSTAATDCSGQIIQSYSNLKCIVPCRKSTHFWLSD